MSEEQHPILNQLEQIQQDALAVLETAVDEAGITAWRSAHLGRTSSVMTVFSQMGQFPKELRPLVGQRANQVKLALEAALAEQAERVRQAELAQKLAAETLDVTLPGRPQTLGRLHPITQTLREIYRVMGEMGFQVYRARDVETDDYNFTLLKHPSPSSAAICGIPIT